MWHICMMMMCMMLITIWLMVDYIECDSGLEKKIRMQQRMLAKSLEATRDIEKSILGVAATGTAGCTFYSAVYMGNSPYKYPVMATGGLSTLALGSWFFAD